MLVLPGLLLVSCVEEFMFENETFEYLLVVDATLTDEVKHHEIYINRAHKFEALEPNKVTGATVKIIGNNTTYLFEEKVSGTYVSLDSFSAQPNITYHLEITTKNGNNYTSSTNQLTTKTNIDNLYAVREVNANGEDGVGLYIDSFDPSSTSNYYRYEFDETFKVIAPRWVDKDAYIVIEDYPDCAVGLIPRPEDFKICYRTETSPIVNVTTTLNLTEDRLQKFPVNFLSSEDYKISHRYSIMVRQYVITEQAYAFWDIMNSFVEEGSLFSQVQGGFVAGNITSVSNSNEKVIGFFEVSATDSKRIYFNYEDFYPGEPLPPYAVVCELDAPPVYDPINPQCGYIMDVIRNRGKVYLQPNVGEFPGGGPYIMVLTACGDCRALGETEPPGFWVE